LSAWLTKYPSIPAPVTHRTHCVSWADWATQPKVELAHGIHLDTNYYYYPDTWMATKPGFMIGSGMPQRFADLNGSVIDIYQANTDMTDESGQAYPATADAMLNKALGPEGYYGFFVVNMHTDFVASPESDAVIASAQARGVPVISAKQLLDWTTARNASTFTSMTWSGTTLSFQVVPGTGANGLEAMLPMQSTGRTLTTLTWNGSPVAFTAQTIKGISYAFFPAAAGTYGATYS